MDNQNLQGRAKVVLVSCVLFNLFLGILYAWTVLRSHLENTYGWTVAQGALPFSLAIGFFAVFMFIGGRIQDKIGPRWVMTAGGAFVGGGVIIGGLFGGTNPLYITIAFGIIAGIGGGLGYACATPPAVKWFHASKKGTISGCTVGGFGLAATYMSPLVGALLIAVGLQRTMIFMGIGIAILTILCAQFVKNPPEGYIAPAPENFTAKAASAAPSVDYTWTDMMKTRLFWMIFIMFISSAFVGLALIGTSGTIASVQLGLSPTPAATLAMVIAIANTLGRVLGGMLSDKIGRINTFYLMLIVQSATMIAFLFFSELWHLIIGVAIVGACFGAFLAVFPAITADQFGLKNLGKNYGIMFLAWGIAGFINAPIQGLLIGEGSGAFNAVYIFCAIVTGAMIVVNFLIKKDIDRLNAKAQ